jgi:hypothetical protein
MRIILGKVYPFFILLIVSDAISRIKEIQQEFLSSFQSRCSKYQFVEKWMQMLDDPPKKVRTFSR